jgi:hypothetical protein
MVPLITLDEYISATLQQVPAWDDCVVRTSSSPGPSYPIPNSCRALYNCITGEQASRIGAADRAASRFSHHTDIFERAKGWPWTRLGAQLTTFN